MKLKNWNPSRLGFSTACMIWASSACVVLNCLIKGICDYYTAISRKVVGKSERDNAERYCGWFWVHFSSKKFARMAREAVDVCLQLLKERNNATVSGTGYWSYPILPFGIVACAYFFPTTFLEIAVYIKNSVMADPLRLLAGRLPSP